MNRQKWLALGIVFVLVGAAALYLHGWGLHQRLGQPSIRATPTADGILMDIQLPADVLNYTSEVVDASGAVTNMLPNDTSLAARKYTAPDGFAVAIQVVMMGKDRTSIHKPEYCLTGQGWTIEKKEPMTIAMAGPPGYTLPAMKWTLSKPYNDAEGNTRTARGFYIFWFTADNKLTGSHWDRLFWMWGDLLKTGVLDRWSYISYFTYFPPAYEETASERIKEFVAASAPQFQLPPKASDQTVAAK